MNISFLNPWFLAGLPVISIPIIIHLLSKKKTITRKFSYVKFIQLASTKVVKRHKLKQLLLLLLRTLLLLLLVLLFARPIVHVAPIFARGRDTSLSNVIVLDSSYSMGYKEEQSERFSIAKDAAKRILKLMEKYDRTAYLLVSDRLEAGIKYLTSDTDILIDEIENSSLGPRSSNILPAVSEAYSLLKGSLSPNKQIILITDMAQNGWAEINEDAINKYDPKVKLIIIDVAKTDSPNIAVTGMEKGVMTTGQMMKIKATINNFSDSAVSNLLVWMSVAGRTNGIKEGRKADQGFIELQKKEEKEKDFFYNFPEEGTYLGKINIKEDALAVDDCYWFKTSVHDKIRVLCIDGEPGFSSFDKETFYLRFALDPYDKGLSIIPTIITVNELGNYNLPEFSVMISANVKEFNEVQIKSMYDFVRKGGGLIFFLGDNVNKDFYNDFLGGLLPGKLDEISRYEKGWTIGYRDEKHPALKIFSGEEQSDLSLGRFFSWYKVRPAENSKVLLRVASGRNKNMEHEGQPLMLERRLPYSKSGRIMLFTSTVDREWNNFPAKPLFLPLMQQVMSYMTERSSKEGYRDSLKIGEPAIIPLKTANIPDRVTLRLPSGKKEIILPVKSEAFNGIEFSGAGEPGIYEFEWVEAGRSRKEHVVYNLDAELGESDLTKIKMRDIKKLLPQTPVILIGKLAELEKILLSVLHGKEASKMAVIFIFGLFMLEGYVANRRNREE